MQTNHPIDMFTPAQAGSALCVDDETLVTMVNDGRLPGYRIGGHIRFKVADVAAAAAPLAVA